MNTLKQGQRFSILMYLQTRENANGEDWESDPEDERLVPASLHQVYRRRRPAIPGLLTSVIIIS